MAESKYRKYKINGKTRSNPKRKAGVTPPTTPAQQAADQTFSKADQEIIDKINDFHLFMTQRGVPYVAVARTPDSGYPAGQFSFNHEHNKPEQTHRNAEWVFAHMGNMLGRATNGRVRLTRTYE